MFYGHLGTAFVMLKLYKQAAACLVLITHSVKYQNTVASLRCLGVVCPKHANLSPLHNGEVRNTGQF